MSRNKEQLTTFVRVDRDKHGNEIPIYRQTVRYLSKAELKSKDDAIAAEGKRLFEEALKKRKAEGHGEDTPKEEVVHNESASDQQS